MNYRTRLIGQKFGRLEVIDFYDLAKGKKTIWLCKCECGEQKTIRNDCLVDGSTRSCGCISNLTGKENKCWKGYGDISKSFWNTIRNGAIKRNLGFDISIEYAWNLYLKQNKRCALTGEEINFGRTKVDVAKTASLDRIDPTLGYIEGIFNG